MKEPLSIRQAVRVKASGCSFVALLLSLALAPLNAGRSAVIEPTITPSASSTHIKTQKSSGEAPLWTIGFGKEFWRRPLSHVMPHNANVSNVKVSGAGSINVDEVIERVSHTFVTDTLHSSHHVKTKNYSAALDGNGLHLTSQAREGDSSVRFRTLSARRQQHDICLPSESELAAWALGNTLQTLLDPSSGLVVHYEAMAAGISVTWIFNRRIGGSGSLFLEAQLSSLHYLRKVGDGLTFVDSSEESRWKVGSVTAVDSRGCKWPVQTCGEGDRLCIEVPEAVLEEATFPLAIDPIISPEFWIGDPVPTAKADNQYYPAVAGFSNVFLVVWDDGGFLTTQPGKLCAARVSSSGEVLDPDGIFLSTEKGKPAVASNGREFLVVWKMADESSGPPIALRGVKVDVDGGVSSNYLALASDVVRDGAPPTIAALGTDYLVAWTRQYYSYPPPEYGPIPSVQRIQARLVTGGGGMGDPFAVGSAAGGQAQPSAASNGSEYFVAYQQDGWIYGTRVTGSGTVIDSDGIPISPPNGTKASPRVGSANGEFLVVWEDQRNVSYDVYGARISGAGALLDPTGIPIATNAQVAEGSPCVAASTTNYLVSWVEQPTNGSAHVKAAILRYNGMTSTLLPISAGPATMPAAAWTGETYLIVWSGGGQYYDRDVFGAIVTHESVVGEAAGFEVSTSSSNDRYSPAVAFNGEVYLAVWSDTRNYPVNGFDIYGARVTRSGSVLDPSGIAISTATGHQRFPALASNGTDFLVVWQDERDPATYFDIYGTVVTGSGVVLNESGLPICAVTNAQTSPAVASDGQDYLVVWEDQRHPFPVSNDIYATRVTKAGEILDAGGFVVCSIQDYQRFPSVASCGGEYLVVWQDSRNSADFGHDADIYGARISRTGAVRDQNGFPISLAPSRQQVPRAAASATNYLVVWQDFRSALIDVYGNGPADIYGTLVDTNATVQFPNGIPIAVATNTQSLPSVAGAPDGFLVVWQDSRNFGTNGSDVYAARVTGTGQVLDSSGWRISDGRFTQSSPQIAFGDEESFLTVSTGSRQDHPSVAGNLIFLSERPLIYAVNVTNGVALLSWFTEPGQTYRGQYKQSLEEEGWADLGGEVTANGRSASITDTNIVAAQKFYRIVRSP